MQFETAIIAVANEKGGVGKTTTALTIGTGLARRGYKVLLVDLDAQCSLTENLIDFVPEATLFDAFIGPKATQNLKRCVVKGSDFVNPLDGVDLLPASKAMKDLDMMLAAKTQHEMILAKIFRNLEVSRHYEFIVIDCPPALSLLTKNALAACTTLFVPTTAEYTPVAGLVKLQEECEEIAEDLNPGLGIDGIIVTRFNHTKNLNVAAMDSLRENFGKVVFDTPIRENIRLAEAPQYYKDIFSYAPVSNGAKDYNNLIDEIEERFGTR